MTDTGPDLRRPFEAGPPPMASRERRDRVYYGSGFCGDVRYLDALLHPLPAGRGLYDAELEATVRELYAEDIARDGLGPGPRAPSPPRAGCERRRYTATAP